MKEIWKTIKEYPDYGVSNLGNVRHKNRVLRPSISIYGYKVVLLYNHGKRRSHFVHRLVAFAFIPNPNNLPQVNHINGVKTDNAVTNLEWCNNQQNMKHAHKIGLITKQMMSQARNHLKKPVLKILNGVVVARYDSLAQASENEDRKEATISQYCNNYYKDSRGYEWRYDL